VRVGGSLCVGARSKVRWLGILKHRIIVAIGKPPGIKRRDLIGMKCRPRMMVARRRAVAVVAGTRSRSRRAEVGRP
jgi:hypothetical protein